MDGRVKALGARARRGSQSGVLPRGRNPALPGDRMKASLRVQFISEP
jgi:hypothetical protein